MSEQIKRITATYDGVGGHDFVDQNGEPFYCDPTGEEFVRAADYDALAVSPGDLRARIEQLAEKWQQHAAICAANGYHAASTNLDQCADELLALLGAAQEQP